MSLVALPSSIIQTARDLREIVNRIQNRPQELSDLTRRLGFLLDSATLIETAVAFAQDRNIISDREAQRWNEEIAHLGEILQLFYAEVERAKRNGLNALHYFLGLDGIRVRQRELSRTLETLNLAFNALKMYCPYPYVERCGVHKTRRSDADQADAHRHAGTSQALPRGNPNALANNLAQLEHGEQQPTHRSCEIN